MYVTGYSLEVKSQNLINIIRQGQQTLKLVLQDRLQKLISRNHQVLSSYVRYNNEPPKTAMSLSPEPVNILLPYMAKAALQILLKEFEMERLLDIGLSRRA